MKVIAKICFFMSVFFAGVLSQAKTVECITRPVSTSFLFFTEGDKASLTVIHHNGVEYAPLMNGAITASSLDIAKKRFGYLTKMGAQFSVDFDVSTCEFEKSGDMSCYHKGPAKIGDLDVQGYYFEVYKEVTKNKFGTFTSYKVSFDYRIGSWSHPIGMEYYEGDCSIY